MLGRIAKEYRFEWLWEKHMTLVTKCMYCLGILFEQHLPDVKALLVNIFIQLSLFI